MPRPWDMGADAAFRCQKSAFFKIKPKHEFTYATPFKMFIHYCESYGKIYDYLEPLGPYCKKIQQILNKAVKIFIVINKRLID